MGRGLVPEPCRIYIMILILQPNFASFIFLFPRHPFGTPTLAIAMKKVLIHHVVYLLIASAFPGTNQLSTVCQCQKSRSCLPTEEKRSDLAGDKT